MRPGATRPAIATPWRDDRYESPERDFAIRSAGSMLPLPDGFGRKTSGSEGRLTG
jgi:hypothetical protein